MKYFYAFSCALMLFTPQLHAQNSFRNSNNPYYWKNRKPFEGYWQQDVQYIIKAKVDDKTDILEGTEQLTYFNNSPDELTFVYFHLYQNAFQPGSYADDLQKSNKVSAKYGKYESQKLGTTVDMIKVDGQDLKTELDNTILKVYLNKPLRSGQSIVFDVKFKTYFDPAGNARRRMKVLQAFKNKQFDGVHWYPRISTYDRKFGWTTDQHLGKEFYGDFGSYDVEVSLPNNYVTEGTGILLNRSEVLPDSLRKKLDVKNFANKPLNSAPSVVIKADGSYKTWKYHADNVHDFAFTADPTYRIGEAHVTTSEGNDVQCISLVREQHAAKWQNAAEYTAQIIKVYSEDIGPYAYPKMVVADAEDGMEYPMLTLDGGLDPGYRSLLAHEVGHNWFFGMVGNNETYRAALDEGFTQFLTSWCMDKLEGPSEAVQKDTTSFMAWYVNAYTKPVTNRDRRTYNAYLNDAIKGEDMPLNTHSDQFNGALAHGGGYRHVYYKTATMLYNLQYTLGDSLFLLAMQHYFDQWKFCHPYFEDFRNSIIQYTHVDLNWFFDQWLETTKNIDYKVCSVKKGKEENEYLIKFKRKGAMQMPLDFTVFTDDYREFNFHIPNQWFIKKTNATVLPKWEGWDNLRPYYTAHIKIPAPIEHVAIDTTHRLADINLMDNSSKIPMSLEFDSRIYNPADRTKYEVKARPDIWYNSYDGIKLGVHMDGSYLHYKNVFETTVWFNTGFAQDKKINPIYTNRFDPISYTFKYRTGIDKFSKNTYFNVFSRSLDGLIANGLGFDKTDNSGNNTFFINGKSMYRNDSSAAIYLLYPAEWLLGKFNNTLNVGLDHRYNYFKGSGAIRIAMRSSAMGSDYSYSNMTLLSINHSTLGKFSLHTRFFAQYGMGVHPKESALYLAGANPEELMENKFTRSRGIVDNTWLGYGAETNHFQQGGGLNLRGYAGYLVTEQVNGEIRTTYQGSSGTSASVELDFNRLFKIRPSFTREWLHIDTYLFADGGVINENKRGERLSFGNFRTDAGAGTAYTIKKWGPLQIVNPLTIRVDFPLLLNHPPAAEHDYFKYRWVVGISRSF